MLDEAERHVRPHEAVRHLCERAHAARLGARREADLAREERAEAPDAREADVEGTLAVTDPPRAEQALGVIECARA